MGLLRHNCSTVGKPSRQQQDLTELYGFGSVVSLRGAFPHNGHTRSEGVALMVSITILLRHEMPSKCTVSFNYQKDFMLRWYT